MPLVVSWHLPTGKKKNSPSWVLAVPPGTTQAGLAYPSMKTLVAHEDVVVAEARERMNGSSRVDCFKG